MMKLFEIYEDMMTSESWSMLDEYLTTETLLQEIDSVNINELLGESKLLIFEAFGINPSEAGKYFIGGSARLFKNPMLLKVLNELDKNFPLTVGDLDVVIPTQESWETLYTNYTTDSPFIQKLSQRVGEKNISTVVDRFKKQWKKYDGKIYRPGSSKDGLKLSHKDIEAFTEWRPDLAKGARDVKVRSTEQILNDAVKLGGYYYMSIYDVFDYKFKLGREKELPIVKLIEKFMKGAKKPEEAEKLFKNIYNIIGK